MSKTMIAVACIPVLCGCAGLVRQTREELLDGHGVSSPMLVIEAGAGLRFVNRDVQPHQIYSNDCGELSSTLLYPGDAYTAQIGSGPKVCHFQDLLSPSVAGYSGTLQVHDNEEERRRETAD